MKPGNKAFIRILAHCQFDKYLIERLLCVKHYITRLVILVPSLINMNVRTLEPSGVKPE